MLGKAFRIGIGLESRENTDLKRMLGFLKAHGGRVPFDKYMQENLYSQDGYFPKAAKIGPAKEDDFLTHAIKPEFAFLLSAYLESRGLSNRDFLELGGGTGVFKNNLLAVAPRTNFISVDISQKFAAMQRDVGQVQSRENFDTMIGSADNIPLRSKSVDGIIFANEILDNMPARVFKVKVAADGTLDIDTELFVEARDGKKVTKVFGQPSQDNFLREYQEFLRMVQPQRRMATGENISVSPQYEKLISELNRVLNRGMILLFDYGFGVGNDYERAPDSSPYYMKDRLEERDYLEKPYKTDLTYCVDFAYFRFLVERMCKECVVTGSYEQKFFDRVLNTYPELRNAGPSSGIDFNTLTHPRNDFKVLQIEKGLETKKH